MFVGEATKVLPRPRAPCGRREGPGVEVEADCMGKQSLGKSLGRLPFAGLLLGPEEVDYAACSVAEQNLEYLPVSAYA